MGERGKGEGNCLIYSGLEGRSERSEGETRGKERWEKAERRTKNTEERGDKLKEEGGLL